MKPQYDIIVVHVCKAPERHCIDSRAIQMNCTSINIDIIIIITIAYSV